jgi:hypothetical protein
VVVSASLSATDEDDIVAFTATAPALVKGTWTHDIETRGVIVWTTPAIVGTGPAPRSLSLSTTDEDDTVHIELSLEGAIVPLGGKTVPGRRKWINFVSKPELIIPETQEIPEVYKPKPAPKRKIRKINVAKYEMLDIPKVISEGWKPKEKYRIPVAPAQLEPLLPKAEVKKKPEIDFEALERELTEAVKKKRIQEQNDLIIMLAMEEA